MANTFTFDTGDLSKAHYDGRYMELTCTQTKDITTNTSKIAWKLETIGGNVNYYYTGPTTLTIDGQEVYYRARTGEHEFPCAKGSVSGTLTVEHDTSGEKTISVVLGTSIYYKQNPPNKREAEWVLDSIPRAATLNEIDYTESGNKISITCDYSKAENESFTYSMDIYINGFQIAEAQTLSYLYELNNKEVVYNNLPDQDQGNLTLKLTTKNGDTVIGISEKTIIYQVPEDVKPTININGVSLVSQAREDETILQGQDAVKLDISASPGLGSVLLSYDVKVVDSKNNLIASSSFSFGQQILMGPFRQTGNLTFQIAAKDKRGRYSELKKANIQCQEYFLPTLSGFEAFRSDSEGNSDADGKYLTCTFLPGIADILGNSATIKLYLDENEPKSFSITDTNSITINLNENTSTHRVYLEIQDNYYSGQKTGVLTVFGSARILNIAADGLGIAFGKKAEDKKQNNSRVPTFECAWNAEFYGDLKIARAQDAIIKLYSLLDIIYPVGSIYMSTSDKNPSTLFGFGTWTQIQNTFLLAAGSNYTAGNTGGSATTTLSTNNLPAHNHEANSTYNGADFDIRAGSNDDRYLVAAGNNTTVGSGEGANKWTAAFSISTSAPSRKNDKVYIGGAVTTTTKNTGSGEAFSNMPPYLAVYMWKRTA